MNNKSLTGIKIFRELENDQLEIFRVKGLSKDNQNIILFDENNNVQYKPLEVMKEYKILKSDGMFMISIVNIDDGKGTKTKDVITSVTKSLELEVGLMKPFAVCRQSINDVFYNLICKDTTDVLAGLSVNRDNCPTNFDFGIMMSCTEVLSTEIVYFYREDTLEDVLALLEDTRRYNKVLEELFLKHCLAPGVPAGTRLKKEHGGWCKDLKTLLTLNNFSSDMDEMLGITSVTFKFSDYLVEKPLPDESKGNYLTTTDDLKLWLSGTFRIAINDITVLEYDHDIDLSELNHARYFFIRDNCNKLYICVYTINGQYLESDLQDAYEKKSFVEEWMIKFVDKYKEYHN